MLSITDNISSSVQNKSIKQYIKTYPRVLYKTLTNWIWQHRKRIYISQSIEIYPKNDSNRFSWKNHMIMLINVEKVLKKSNTHKVKNISKELICLFESLFVSYIYKMHCSLLIGFVQF